MEKYLLLLMVVIIGTLGQILLKITANQLTPQLPEIQSFGTLLQAIFIFLKNYKILLLVLLYGLGFFIWFLALTKFELSHAFPLISIIYVLVLAVSWIFLKEQISALGILGSLFIMLGIFFVAKSA